MSKGKSLGTELHDVLSPHKHKKGRAVDPKFKTDRPSLKDKQHRGGLSTVSGLIQKTPEAMTKITKFSKGGDAAKGHLLYITRNGKLEIENESGELLKDKKEIFDLIKEFKENINSEKRQENTRTLMHLMLSMPKGTEPEAVKNAARNFARENFGANHQYAFVLHTDKPHPHVHIAVRTLGKDGKRLNPRKADLAEWRLDFARWMRMEGVDAIATPRAIRAVTHKAEKSAVHHIQHDPKQADRSTATKKRIRDAAAEILADLRPGQPVVPEVEKNKAVQESIAASIKKQRTKIISTLQSLEADLRRKPIISAPSLETMLKSRETARERAIEYARHAKASGTTRVFYPGGGNYDRWRDRKEISTDLLQSGTGEFARGLKATRINRLRSMPDLNVVYKRGKNELLLLTNSYRDVGRVNGRSDSVRRASSSNGTIYQGVGGREAGINPDDLKRYIDEIAQKPIHTRHQELKQKLLNEHKLRKGELHALTAPVQVEGSVADTKKQNAQVKQKNQSAQKIQTAKDAHKQR